MENLKLPAYPQPITIGTDGNILTPVGHHSDFGGFTKLEKASLMIAQGMLSGPHKWEKEPVVKAISVNAVAIAKAVLEEANK